MPSAKAQRPRQVGFGGQACSGGLSPGRLGTVAPAVSLKVLELELYPPGNGEPWGTLEQVAHTRLS